MSELTDYLIDGPDRPRRRKKQQPVPDPKDARISALTAEVERLREQAKLEYEASLCGDHAAIWYTARNTLKSVSGCVVCDAVSENARLREARTELRTELEAAYKLLRRGQRAIDRQEWEKGETASEWYSAAGTFCGSYEARAAIDAAKDAEKTV